MRILIFLFILMCSQSCFAQSIEDTLKNLSIEWMKALERKDSLTLERFLAKEYTLSGVGESESVDRVTWMKNAIGKTWGNTSYEFKGIRVEGNQALVNSVMDFTVKPIPFVLEGDILDHWVYRDGRWQVRARYMGGDSIRNFISMAKGYLVGVVMILVVLWLRRFSKRSKVKQETHSIHASQ